MHFLVKQLIRSSPFKNDYDRKLDVVSNFKKTT